MSELGAGTRGSSLGYRALEMASLKFGKRMFQQYPVVELKTFNDHLYKHVNTPFAKHISGILESATAAGNKISSILKEGKLPFVISGDHCNAASTIYGIKQQYPEKRLGVIWIDAHADLHSPYTSPSGNMHGMPLAISLSEDNLEKKRNNISEESIEKWNLLKNLGDISPKILASDLVYFGVRDTESAEDYLIRKYNIRNFKVEEVRHKGIEVCAAEALNLLKDCDLIYISFDVDALDCDMVSRGTGTPVEKGFSPLEAENIMKFFIKDERLVCWEMVEINPLLDDKENEMAETAVRIMDNVIRFYNK